jgi:hypothetical protein
MVRLVLKVLKAFKGCKVQSVLLERQDLKVLRVLVLALKIQLRLAI